MGARCVHCCNMAREGFAVALKPFPGLGDVWQCDPVCKAGHIVRRYVSLRSIHSQTRVPATVGEYVEAATPPANLLHIVIEYSRLTDQYHADLHGNGTAIGELFTVGNLERTETAGTYFALPLSVMYQRCKVLADALGIVLRVKGSARRALAELGIHPD